MYIGPFYFDTKEIFLIIAVGLISLAMYFDWPLWEFEAQNLLVVTIMILIVKGLLQSTHNDTFFFHSIITVLLTLFMPIFYVILFYFITFAILRLFKMI